jgi:hypothetical protein
MATTLATTKPAMKISTTLLVLSKTAPSKTSNTRL